MKLPVAILMAFSLLLPAGVLYAKESPYAGMQEREIKALSPEEISGFLAGEGMGFAMPAELNGYPGPKHVLMLVDELDLEDTQVSLTEAEYERMRQEAIRIGGEIVALERALDALFAENRVNKESMESIVGDLGKLRAELRLAHLQAHLTMREILSPDQIASYNRIRGYGSDHHPGHLHQQPGQDRHHGDH